MKTAVLIALVFLTTARPLFAADLITESEAGLPNVERNEIRLRGITRGPGIRLISPRTDRDPVQCPFDLRLEFVAYGNAKIDPETVKFLYDKNPPVNLIERVRSGVSERGIVVIGAQVPAGRHTLIITVTDTDGRSTTQAFDLTVVP